MTIDDFASEEDYVAQAGTGAMLNPRMDATFKALFTQPTAESRGALHSFLEAATGRAITHVTLLPNEAQIAYRGQRRVDYDILCDFDDGECANIEMQAFNQRYDYGRRAEHHVARILATKLKKGDKWQNANKAYQISVLDFVYDAGSAGVVSRYAMRTKDGRELSNLQNIIFVELPKVAGKEKSIERNTALENWAVFLREADNPQKTVIIQELTSKEAGLMQAQKSLSSLSADRMMWWRQFREEVAERDRISSIAAVEEEGLKRGFERGFSNGMEQGMQKGIEQGMQQGIEQGMQQGMQKGIEQGMQQGIEQGMQQGMQQGINQGMQQGMQQGLEQGKLLLAKKYMAMGHTAEEAAAFAEIDAGLLH